MDAWVQQIKKHPLVSGLVAVAVAAVTALETALYVFAKGDKRDDLRSELFKGILQLVLVAVIGGGVSYIYKNVDNNRIAKREKEAKAAEETKQRREVAKSYVNRLGEAYRNVRGTRRTLRVEGLTNTYHQQSFTLSNQQREVYHQQMLVISQAQHTIEALRVEAEYFFPKGQLLRHHLRTMERYLSAMITEYEQHYPQPQIVYANLTKLDEFTLDRSATTPTKRAQVPAAFSPLFAGAHADAIRELARD